MVLKLKYRCESPIPVELEGLTPDWVCDKSLSEIERFDLLHGNQNQPLAELFDIAGDPSDKTVVIEGSLGGVHWIGAGMKSGSIRIEGPVGRHLGSGLCGGQIVVEGNASDWVGAEMHGGSIHVRGNVGNLAGAAYRGSTKGMTGGDLWIEGNAGDEIGLCQRRGMIAIRGSAGQFVGAGMIAGTILVFGDCGIRPGAGMRRGTLGLFSANPPALLPTFRYGSTFQPQFVSLMLRQLQVKGFPIDESLMAANMDLYHGDMLVLGRGEILLRHDHN